MTDGTATETTESTPAAGPEPDVPTVPAAPDATVSPDAGDGTATPAPDADPDPADTEPHSDVDADVDTEPDAEAEPSVEDRAKGAAESVMQRRIEQATKDSRGRAPTSDEADLILVGKYAHGFKKMETPGTTRRVDNLEFTDADGSVITITQLVQQRREPGAEPEQEIVVFTCKGTDASGAEVTKEIPGAVLAGLHLNQKSESIMKNFDGKQKQIMEWYVSEKGVDELALTAEDLDNLEQGNPDASEPGSLQEVTHMWDRRLNVAIQNLQGTGNRFAKDSPERAKYDESVRHLRLAMDVSGVVGTFARQAAIKTVIENLGEGVAIPNSLKQANTLLENNKDERIDELISLAEDVISTDQKDALKNFLNGEGDVTKKVVELFNPDSLHPIIKALHADPEHKFATALLKSTDEDKLIMYTDHMMAYHPDEEVRAKWANAKNVLKVGGVGLGILALILLAGTGMAVSSLSKVGGQRAG